MSTSVTATRPRPMRLLVAALVAVCALVTGWAWAVASPLGSSPDEEYHLASIWCPPPVESSGCEVSRDAQQRLTVDVPEAIAPDAICWRNNLDASAGCANGMSEEVLAPSWRVDQGQYPGGMYKVLHLLVGEDVHASVLAARMAGGVLAVLLGIAVVAVGDRSVRRQLACMVLGAYVPMGVYLVASVNPSGWSLLGVSTVFLAMQSLLRAVGRRHVVASAALVAVGVLVALCARGDAGPMVAVAAVASALIGVDRVRRRPLLLLAPLAVCAAGAYALVGSLQVTNAQQAGAAEGVSTVGRTAQRVFLDNLADLPGLVTGAYGSSQLGQLDAPLPSLVHVPALLAAGGICLAGMRQLSLGKVAAIGMTLAAVCAIPMYMLQTSLLRVGEVVQPRYVLPLLPVLVGCCVAPTGSRVLSLTRGQALAVWGAVTVAHATALLFLFRRFATGLDGAMLPRTKIEWQWPGAPVPATSWLLGSLAFAVAALALVLVSTGQADEPTYDRRAVGAGSGGTVTTPGVPATERRTLTPSPSRAVEQESSEERGRSASRPGRPKRREV